MPYRAGTLASFMESFCVRGKGKDIESLGLCSPVAHRTIQHILIGCVADNQLRVAVAV